MTITRQTLITCIEEGIAAVGDDLHPVSADLLREVGRTTTSVGSTYMGDFVCPATQAGLFTTPWGAAPGVVRFAYAYDDALASHGVFTSPRGAIEVI